MLLFSVVYRLSLSIKTIQSGVRDVQGKKLVLNFVRGGSHIATSQLCFVVIHNACFPIQGPDLHLALP
jgi:hypothetical protein